MGAYTPRHNAYFYVIAQYEYYFLLDKTITTLLCEMGCMIMVMMIMKTEK